MNRKNLRHGYTTGACAAAAARGAVLMLRDQHLHDEVDIILPRGETVRFRLHGQLFTQNSAVCFVVKDAGDDPDVTHGAEIHAQAMLAEASGDGAVIIRGGAGVGRVTKPGLAVPVGEWAINPVPRRMITTAVNEVLSLHCPLFAGHCAPVVPHVTISITNGEELAKKTLNARLGIIGGLSILGTTGIVRPISSQAWTDTIDASIDVALACGCSTLVLSTGRTSERAAQRFFSRVEGSAMSRAPTETPPVPCAFCPLPDEAYIMMGDHVGHTLRACESKGVRNVVLAAQFAKLLKIACNHEQTHVSSSTLDLRTLADWLKGSPRVSHLASLASRSATAREVFESSGKDPDLAALVCHRAAVFAARLAPGLRVQVFLAGYGGEMIYFR
jgi:cobalt-precorrin-5B (C1)-methyltransferase